jgi:hypothetical protein
VSVQFAIVVAALNAYAGVLGPVIAAGGAGVWSLILVAQTLGTFAGLAAAARTRPPPSRPRRRCPPPAGRP